MRNGNTVSFDKMKLRAILLKGKQDTNLIINGYNSFSVPKKRLPAYIEE
jgi:hypothetical protein